MLKNTVDYKKNKIEFMEIEDITVPMIESVENTEENIKALSFLLIDGVLCGKNNGYKTNEKHLIYFNGTRTVIWINIKGFIHMVTTEKKYGEHYRIHPKKNIIENINDGFYNSKELINNCINVQEKYNIYQ